MAGGAGICGKVDSLFGNAQLAGRTAVHLSVGRDSAVVRSLVSGSTMSNPTKTGVRLDSGDLSRLGSADRVAASLTSR